MLEESAREGRRCAIYTAGMQVFRFCGYYRPSAVVPDVVDAGRSNRAEHNASSIAQCVAALRASARFAANHLRDAVRNSNGNTIETSRADHRDESNLCAATPKAALTSTLVAYAFDEASWPFASSGAAALPAGDA